MQCGTAKTSFVYGYALCIVEVSSTSCFSTSNTKMILSSHYTSLIHDKLIMNFRSPLKKDEVLTDGQYSARKSFFDFRTSS